MRGQSSEWDGQEITQEADADNGDGAYTPPKRVTVAFMSSLKDPP